MKNLQNDEERGFGAGSPARPGVMLEILRDPSWTSPTANHLDRLLEDIDRRSRGHEVRPGGSLDEPYTAAIDPLIQLSTVREELRIDQGVLFRFAAAMADVDRTENDQGENTHTSPNWVKRIQFTDTPNADPFHTEDP